MARGVASKAGAANAWGAPNSPPAPSLLRQVWWCQAKSHKLWDLTGVELAKNFGARVFGQLRLDFKNPLGG